MSRTNITRTLAPVASFLLVTALAVLVFGSF